MSLHSGLPRYIPRIILSSIRQSQQKQIPLYHLHSLSLSTHEQPKHTIVPPIPPSSSLRETKRPETIHTPPAPPRNATPSATSITTSSDQSSSPSPSPSSSAQTTTSSSSASATPASAVKQPKFAFKPLKAALTLTPAAISRLQDILDQPNPKLVRVGVKNRGCAGLAYHLEYVDKPGKFDEIVEQDGTHPFEYANCRNQSID